jgi:hypothetical protein
VTELAGAHGGLEDGGGGVDEAAEDGDARGDAEPFRGVGAQRAEDRVGGGDGGERGGVDADGADEVEIPAAGVDVVEAEEGGLGGVDGPRAGLGGLGERAGDEGGDLADAGVLEEGGGLPA